MNFVQVLLTTTHQLHVYHWQTDSYAEHQAFGQAYDTLDGLMDQFVETFMGKYGKVASKGGFEINLSNITDKKPNEFIDSVIDFLTNELPKSLKSETDTDLIKHSYVVPAWTLNKQVKSNVKSVIMSLSIKEYSYERSVH